MAVKAPSKSAKKAPARKAYTKRSKFWVGKKNPPCFWCAKSGTVKLNVLENDVTIVLCGDCLTRIVTGKSLL